MSENPFHSMGTAEWGSPSQIVEPLRRVFGGRIDLDVASNWYWNRCTVRADLFFGTQSGDDFGDTLSDGEFVDGLVDPWPTNLHIICNPPGDKRGTLTKAFWRRAVECALHGGTVGWIGYSLEQLQSLQTTAPPLRYPTCVVRGRVGYVPRPPTLGGAPTHGSFVSLLSGSSRLDGAFCIEFSRLGYVTMGDLDG